MWIERLTIDHDRHDDDDNNNYDDVISLSHFDCSRVNYRHPPSHKLLYSYLGNGLSFLLRGILPTDPITLSSLEAPPNHLDGMNL
jgi:hypothetical protein